MGAAASCFKHPSMRESVRQLGVQLRDWPVWYRVAVRGRYSVTHREFTLLGGAFTVAIMGCGALLLQVSTRRAQGYPAPPPCSTGLSLCRVSRLMLTVADDIRSPSRHTVSTQDAHQAAGGTPAGTVSPSHGPRVSVLRWSGTRRCNASPSRRCARMRRTERQRRTFRLRSMRWRSSTGSISLRRHRRSRRDRKRCHRCRQAAGARVLRQCSASLARGLE